MGGVLRAGRTSSIFKEGEGNGQKIFHNGNLVWQKPIPSIYPARVLSTTDNVLFVGSSDLACLTYSNWHPNSHNWPNVFRSNYTGTMTESIGNNVRPGMAAAISLGRVGMDTIVDNANNNVYPQQSNPLNPTSMALYNSLVLDVSDIIFGPGDDTNQYYSNNHMPVPFHWTQYGSRQEWINHELEARMEIIRVAYQAGVRKIFLVSPWPRFRDNNNNPITLSEWYAKFAALEDSMHYQQDRMNFQFKQEGLDIHISMIPFHIIFRDLYEAIENVTAPVGITSILNLSALSDNMDSVSDVTDPALSKHAYMLNYLGTYALNCLFDAIVLDGDPLTKPRTDGTWTVPEPIALWFQNKAVEIRDNYARSGHAIGGDIGYVMPKIRDWTIEEMVGPSLMLHRDTPAVTGTSYPLIQSGTPRHIMAVIEIDRDTPHDGAMIEVKGIGGHGVLVYLTVVNGAVDIIWGGYEQNGLEAVGVTNPPQIAGINRYIIDLILPYPGWINPIDGNNTFLSIMNMGIEQIPYVIDKVRIGRHTTPGLMSPIATQMTCSGPASQVQDIIISNDIISDADKFNIYRNWARKYQQETWEPVWPDMVT